MTNEELARLREHHVNECLTATEERILLDELEKAMDERAVAYALLREANERLGVSHLTRKSELRARITALLATSH